MRVIAGKYKRRLLKTLPGIDVTRPTSDRVKESLFNMLAPEIEGAIVWDLFAGSGALGIESLSRGAAHVTFVEKSPAARKVIMENLKTLAVSPDNYAISSLGVEEFLKNAAKSKPAHEENSASLVSVVLADPPYDSNWYDEALREISLTQKCADGCLLVLEMKAGRVIPPADAKQWTLEDERKYGIAQVQLWRFSRTGE